MLPDWVFRVGWGMPIARSYLQLRMEADQLKVSMAQAHKLRQKLLNVASSTHKNYDEPLHWAIKTSVPGGEGGKSWGDFYFAQEITTALIKQGQIARVDTRDKIVNAESANDDVVLVIRGVERIRPQKGAINVLWVISHPTRISSHELKSFDAVFAASNKWAQSRSKSSGVAITPLLQATNPEKFNPDIAKPDSGEEVLFIGNSRHQFRQIVKDALNAEINPSIYGQDWETFIPSRFVKSTFVPNDEIGKMYRRAGVVLNDHWTDMAANGFYSNRLFDAVAAGARVVSDHVEGLDDVFGGAVKTYVTPDDLKALTSKKVIESWGTADVIEANAKVVGERNSFDARASALISVVEQLHRTSVKD